MSLLSSHDHQWVTPRIAVGGGVWSSDHVDSLLSEGITHVIDCRSDNQATLALYAGKPITCIHCPTDDNGKPKHWTWFAQGVFPAIAALLDNDTNKLLVHCAGGVNRGPSMAYAILRALGLTPRDSWQMITEVRPIAKICYAPDADRFIEGRTS
jgi:dual specificity phosphatase 3